MQKAGSKVVIKNNKLETIMSKEEYLELMEQIENTELIEKICERLTHLNRDLLKTEDEVYNDLNSTEEDLGDFMDVEFD